MSHLSGLSAAHAPTPEPKKEVEEIQLNQPSRSAYTDRSLQILDLIDIYNAIIEGDSVILDLRSISEYISCHISGSILKDPTQAETLNNVKLKKKVLLCISEGHPPQDFVENVKKAQAEQIVGETVIAQVVFKEFMAKYTFLCISGDQLTARFNMNYPTQISSDLFISGEYPAANLQGLWDLGIYNVIQNFGDVCVQDRSIISGSFFSSETDSESSELESQEGSSIRTGGYWPEDFTINSQQQLNNSQNLMQQGSGLITSQNFRFNQNPLARSIPLTGNRRKSPKKFNLMNLSESEEALSQSSTTSSHHSHSSKHTGSTNNLLTNTQEPMKLTQSDPLSRTSSDKSIITHDSVSVSPSDTPDHSPVIERGLLTDIHIVRSKHMTQMKEQIQSQLTALDQDNLPLAQSPDNVARSQLSSTGSLSSQSDIIKSSNLSLDLDNDIDSSSYNDDDDQSQSTVQTQKPGIILLTSKSELNNPFVDYHDELYKQFKPKLGEQIKKGVLLKDNISSIQDIKNTDSRGTFESSQNNQMFLVPNNSGIPLQSSKPILQEKPDNTLQSKQQEIVDGKDTEFARRKILTERHQMQLMKQELEEDEQERETSNKDHPHPHPQKTDGEKENYNNLKGQLELGKKDMLKSARQKVKKGDETPITYYRVSIEDVTQSNLLSELPGVLSFIHNAVQRGRGSSHDSTNDSEKPFFNSKGESSDSNSYSRVLVHCSQGISRSPSVVIAYFMLIHKATYKETLAFVLHRRTVTHPNEGFAIQLQEFEEWLQNREGSTEQILEQMKKEFVKQSPQFGRYHIPQPTSPSPKQPYLSQAFNLLQQQQNSPLPSAPHAQGLTQKADHLSGVFSPISNIQTNSTSSISHPTPLRGIQINKRQQPQQAIRSLTMVSMPALNAAPVGSQTLKLKISLPHSRTPSPGVLKDNSHQLTTPTHYNTDKVAVIPQVSPESDKKSSFLHPIVMKDSLISPSEDSVQSLSEASFDMEMNRNQLFQSFPPKSSSAQDNICQMIDNYDHLTNLLIQPQPNSPPHDTIPVPIQALMNSRRLSESAPSIPIVTSEQLFAELKCIFSYLN
ncbi:MAG: hypothetical protein EZS28_000133 [Streblomastix strix]|uniref:Tyrosine specific protein phosphatases domain-containing protein n=1 Tax=Streblomastix strix TaxID=222440 RepID=A0A5J4XB36_9EUKA|nr:MAG: hypothetical protein EZS28_000133 [Streblomastix strix]